jgi:lipopolysaccharide export LptBFGC system permease protein LptF
MVLTKLVIVFLIAAFITALIVIFVIVIPAIIERRREAKEEAEKEDKEPVPKERKEIKCKVISETTPYTLINVIPNNSSYFQYIFEDEDLTLSISPQINRQNQYEYDSGILLDLEDNAEPYVIIDKVEKFRITDPNEIVYERYKTLHLPANTIIKRFGAGSCE